MDLTREVLQAISAASRKTAVEASDVSALNAVSSPPEAHIVDASSQLTFAGIVSSRALRRLVRGEFPPPPLIPISSATGYGRAYALVCVTGDKTSESPRAVIPSDSSLAASIARGKFRVALSDARRKELVAYEVDFSREVEAEGFLKSAVAALESSTIPVTERNDEAHVAFMLSNERLLDANGTAAASNLLEYTARLGGACSDNRLSADLFLSVSREATSAGYALVAEAARAIAADATPSGTMDILHGFQRRRELAELVKQLGLFRASRDEDVIERFTDEEGNECYDSARNAAYTLERLLEVFLISPRATRDGRQLCSVWFSSLHEPVVHTLALRVGDDSERAGTLWRFHEREALYAPPGLLRATDAPITEALGWNASWPRYETEEAHEAPREMAGQLIVEGAQSKKWTVPPHAVVEVQVGPFRSVELVETPERVWGCFRTSGDEYALASASAGLGDVNVGFPLGAGFYGSSAIQHGLPLAAGVFGDGDDDDEMRFQAGVDPQATLILVFAAIVRDFWLVEERESVFEKKVVASSADRSLRDSLPARVVYLPRVQYPAAERATIATCRDALALREIRTAHDVSGHLRRVQRASSSQLLLARRYGMDVPDGFTFVRPHHRGGVERDIVYRSRSALQALHGSPATSPTTTSPWFRFERDCRQFVDARGLRVLQLSPGREPDSIEIVGGGAGGAATHSFVCTCYGPKRLVSERTIADAVDLRRKLEAKVATVITTSDFTSDARARAEAESVELVDGRALRALSMKVRLAQD